VLVYEYVCVFNEKNSVKKIAVVSSNSSLFNHKLYRKTELEETIFSSNSFLNPKCNFSFFNTNFNERTEEFKRTIYPFDLKEEKTSKAVKWELKEEPDVP